MVDGGLEARKRQMLSNAIAVLTAAGCRPDEAVRSIVFLADPYDYAAVHRIYAELFPEAPPARAAAEAARLPLDAGVEIMTTAIKSTPGRPDAG